MPARLPIGLIDADLLAHGWVRQEELQNTSKPCLCLHLACGVISPIRLDNLRAAWKHKATGCQTCKGRQSANAACTPEEAVDFVRAEGFEPQEFYPGRTSDSWALRHIVCDRIVHSSLKYLRSDKRVGFGCSECATDSLGDRLRFSVSTINALLSEHSLVILSGSNGTLGDSRIQCQLCMMIFFKSFADVTRPEWRCQGCKAILRLDNDCHRVAPFGWHLISREKTAGKYHAEHTCGLRKWIRIDDIGRFGSGCPKCNPGGYSFALPGYLYLVRFPSHEALKIGISNQPMERVGKHGRKNEMEIVYLIGPLDSQVIFDAEKTIKQEWAIAGIKPVETMRSTDGWTETVLEYEVSLAQVLARMEELCGVFV